MTSQRLVRRAALLVVPALLGGCFGLDTGPALQLQKSVAAVNEALPTTASAAGGTARVTVSGRIVGKLPCDLLDGDVQESSTEIRLILKLVADQNHCAGRPPTTWSYVANILELEAGTRTLIVEHRFQGVDGQAGIVLDTVLVVY
ncbi:MAG: hypothetical protein ACRELC_00730 [Gemmatimonadota bacterium]